MKYLIPILIVLISCSSDDSTDYQQVAPTYKNVNYVTITNETTGGGSQFFYLKSGFSESNAESCYCDDGCSKEIIDLVSDNNQLVVDSKLKNEIDKNKSSNLVFFDSNEFCRLGEEILFPSKFSPFKAINNEFFFNDLVSVEIDFINALNFIFLLRNFAKSEVLVINFIYYLMVTKMINFSINFLSLFMSFTKN